MRMIESLQEIEYSGFMRKKKPTASQEQNEGDSSTATKVNTTLLFTYMYSLLTLSMKWGLTSRKIKRFFMINHIGGEKDFFQKHFVHALMTTYVKYIQYTVTSGKILHSILSMVPFGNLLSQISTSMTKDYIVTLENSSAASAYHLTTYLLSYLSEVISEFDLFFKCILILLSFAHHEDIQTMYMNVMNITKGQLTDKNLKFLEKSEQYLGYLTENEKRNFIDQFFSIDVNVKKLRMLSSYKKELVRINMFSEEIERNGKRSKISFIIMKNKKNILYHIYHDDEYKYEIKDEDLNSMKEMKLDVFTKKDADDMFEKVSELESSKISLDTDDVLDMNDTQKNRTGWWGSLDETNLYYRCFVMRKTERKIKLKTFHYKYHPDDEYIPITLINGDRKVQVFCPSNTKSDYGVLQIIDAQFICENLGLLQSDNVEYFVLKVPHSIPYILISFIVLWRSKYELPITFESIS